MGIQMERAIIIRYGLAAFALIALALAATAPAWGQGAATASGQSSPSNGIGGVGGTGNEPTDVYLTIAVEGMAGRTANFAVMNSVLQGKDGRAVLVKTGAPLTGTYNVTTDMGYVSTVNFMPATTTTDTVKNISVPVAGASAVLGLHDMTILAKEKGYKVMQFGQASFFTPNGSAMAYQLDRPVRVTYDEDRQLIVIDAHPSFTRQLAAVFGTGATFPAGALPVPLSSLMTAKKAALGEKAGYEKPVYVAPPG